MVEASSHTIFHILGLYQELSMFLKLPCFILKINVNFVLHSNFALLCFINSEPFSPTPTPHHDHTVASLKSGWIFKINSGCSLIGSIFFYYYYLL